MLNLLLRQHVSVFALGHHQVSTCIKRRTNTTGMSHLKIMESVISPILTATVHCLKNFLLLAFHAALPSLTHFVL